MSIATASAPNVMTSGGAWCGAQKKYISSGIATAAATEPSETYREKPATNRNKMSPPRNAGGQSARYTPAAVATPLPPLNLSHTGKQWPTSAASPAITIHIALSFEYFPATSTATAPFAP